MKEIDTYIDIELKFANSVLLALGEELTRVFGDVKDFRKKKNSLILGLLNKVGGMVCSLPSNANALRQIRNALILKDRSQGVSCREISQKYKLSIDTVQAVLRQEV